MSERKRKQFSVGTLAIGAALLGYAAWVVYPMLWVAFSSLKTERAIAGSPFSLPEPGAFAWEAYRVAWQEARFGDYFLNSVVVTTTSVALIVLLGAMAAYVLARFPSRLTGALHGLFLAGLTLPVQLSLVPLFFELRALGLLNSLPGLILVYTANGLPFAVFILTGFFRALPSALHEAAVLDGCSDAGVFWRVMLPLARPGLITVATFQFIAIWKEYFFAFMLAAGGVDGGSRTLPLGLANLAITAQYRNEYAPLFAGIVLATLPVLAVHLFLQRHLVAGIAAGAVK
ncbi:carbohydrate ABC transporter permease [Nibricoccus sp. IMCC34717]|uniref:carbohydrate ABC transporter permease n=1 Tax=Nibricoccus sp. IMCC34717 TaxID=3034021 RepID=UPI00384A88F3